MKKLALVLVVLAMVGCDNKTTSLQKEIAPNINYLSQGIELLKQGKGADAIESFDNAIRQDPADVQAYLVLGQTYMMIKQYPQAVSTYNAAARVAPNQGEVFYLLALSEAMSGNIQKAFESTQKSISIFQQQNNDEGVKKSAALLEQFMPKSNEAKMNQSAVSVSGQSKP